MKKIKRIVPWKLEMRISGYIQLFLVKEQYCGINADGKLLSIFS